MEINPGKKLIMAVDDEPDIIELVKVNLENNGFRVMGFSSSHEFFAALKKNTPHLIILDLMLPDQDGFEICKMLKRDHTTGAIPIIMLTAKSAEMDRVLGLELGADDYMTKPFSPRELVARVKNILKRTEQHKDKKEVLHFANTIVLDLQRYTASVKGKVVALTITEFKLLSILMENKGWVLSRDQLLEKLWGDEKIVVDRTIDVHIRHLRKKLGPASRFIRNIRGVGYKLEE